jgi:hypothetical protein
VKNNPTNYVDPSGEVQWRSLAVGAAKTFFGAIETTVGAITMGSGIGGTGGGLATCPISAGAGCGVAAGSIAVTSAGAAVTADGALRTANGFKQILQAVRSGPSESENNNAQRSSQQQPKTKPSESKFWKSLQNYRDGIKRSGSGRNLQQYKWDYTHGDIEVYDRFGRHLGSADPQTGSIYKPAVPGRTI